MHKIRSKKMGAPKRWIKTLLGLKKDKLDSREEENSTGSTGRIWLQRKKHPEIDNGIYEIESKQNVDPEFENANLQSVLDPASSPSTSLEVKNAAELQWSTREEWMSIDAKDATVQSASDPVGSPSASFQVQSAAQLNMREEWAAVDAKDSNFQSVPDPTSLPSTSLQVQNTAQPRKGLGEELVAIATEDANLLSVSDPSSPPFTSLKVQQAAHLQLNMREEWAAVRIQTAFRVFLLQNGAQLQQNMSEDSAAIRIQTAFRGFQARRALRALKGLVRLQALVRGHAVRRQAAITLRCMQALVRVQARARARHARMALESQTAQQKLKEQLEEEAEVKQIEDGWCDKTGSADEIQAKLLKRKEAAAKREKAKAYALARQWQAGSRQQATPVGFEPDKSNWGWNWLERWMAVRPWENRFSDSNFNEGMKILENESIGPKNAPLISTGKKSISNTGKGKSVTRSRNNVNSSHEKRDAPYSDGCSPSPSKSAYSQTTPTTLASSRMSSKPVVKDPVKAATSSPSVGLRSLSNPKERSTQSDKQGNKRLSLPGVAPGAPRARRLSVGSAVKSSPTAPKPVNARNKPSRNLSRQVSQ
ncbi:hypothetical protein ACS0TY_020107 [Phlomoides rotata]